MRIEAEETFIFIREKKDIRGKEAKRQLTPEEIDEVRRFVLQHGPVKPPQRMVKIGSREVPANSIAAVLGYLPGGSKGRPYPGEIF